MEIKTKGLDKVFICLNKMEKAAGTFKPAFKDMRKKIINEFKTNFETKGKTLKKPWKPRKHKYPWPLLLKTRKMQKRWGSKISKWSLRIWNKQGYAGYHHFGTSKLKKRRLVNASPRILRIIEKSFLKYFYKNIK